MHSIFFFQAPSPLIPLKTLLLFIILGFPIQAVSGPSFEKSALYLGKGEQKVLSFPHLKRYSLGGKSVRAGRSSHLPHSLLLKGVERGTADLWVWNSDGTSEHRMIHVIPSSSGGRSSKLERGLSRLQEAEVYHSGDHVIIRGPIYSLAESARIAALLEAFPKTLRNETEPSADLLQQGTDRIKAWLTKENLSSQLELTLLGSSLWVRGSLSQSWKLSEVTRQLRSFFPLVQLDVLTLPDDHPTVHFRVFLVEVQKSHFHALGLSWPSSVPTALQITPHSMTQAWQLDVALQSLEGQGVARILSKPELVVRAPGEAELFAGGELPIRTKSIAQSQLQWKPFGLTLKLKVTHATREQVRLEISTEVSSLNPEIGEEVTPGLRTNRMRTQVDAKFETPLFLSGLLQESLRKNARGLPFLQRIPVFGRLFSSEDYLQERSELVAILLPQRNPPRAPLEKIEELEERQRNTPKGPLPAPRNWVSPADEVQLRLSPEFPWNALELPQQVHLGGEND